MINLTLIGIYINLELMELQCLQQLTVHLIRECKSSESSKNVFATAFPKFGIAERSNFHTRIGNSDPKKDRV